MAFEVIQNTGRAGGRSSSTVPEMSFYGKTAQFRINAAAMDVLGNPDKVEIHYDADTGRIALVPSDAAHAVVLRKDSENSSSRYFGFKSLANRAGLPDDARFTVPITVDDATGYHVASVAPETVAEAPAPRRGRAPKSVEAPAEADVTTS